MYGWPTIDDLNERKRVLSFVIEAKWDRRRTAMATETTQVNVLTADALLKHWQGHRKLTRRTIEASPEDKLFAFSVGGMRPFSELAWEFIRMTIPVAEGVSSGKWGVQTSQANDQSGVLKDLG